MKLPFCGSFGINLNATVKSHPKKKKKKKKKKQIIFLFIKKKNILINYKARTSKCCNAIGFIKVALLSKMGKI